MTERTPNEARIKNLQAILAEDAVRQLADGVTMLATLPETYLALSRAANDAHSSAAEIARIVERDPAVSARLLQLVNSTFFGISKRTSSIQKAVNMLGTHLLKSLVLSAHMSSAIDLAPTRFFSMPRYQSYSIRVARLARLFAGARESADEAFTAGIMSGIGQIVFALRAPKQFEKVLARVAATGELQQDVEREVFGTSHAEVGAYLLSTWGIPFEIVECVALHQRPRDAGAGDCELLALVHAAGALARIVICHEPESQLDLDFLARAGMVVEVPKWRRMTETACAENG